MHIRKSLPSTGWYAVLALAVVAALGAATVVGAGLSLWRGTSAQRAVAVPSQPLLRPGSGVITVPVHPTPAASHPAVTRVLGVKYRQPLSSTPQITPVSSHPRVHPSLPAAPSSAPTSGSPESSPPPATDEQPTHPLHPLHPVHPVHPTHPVHPVHPAHPLLRPAGVITVLMHPTSAASHPAVSRVLGVKCRQPLSSTPQRTPAPSQPRVHPSHPVHPVRPTHPVHPVHPAHPQHPVHPPHPDHG